MDNMSSKFGLPQSLLDAVRNIQKEETEYQAKVKALMKKKGITSLSQLSPDEKKAFFSTLDSMHQAKHEEVKPDVAKSFPASGVKKHVAPKGVSTMPKDKEKAKGQPAGSLKKEEIELDEGKVKELMMDINDVASKMRKNKTLEPFVGKFVTAAKKSLNIKKSLEDVLPDYISGAEIAKLYKEEIELDEAIPKSTGYALVHSSSKKIVAKGNKEEMTKKMKEVNAKEKGSHHLGMTNRGKVGDTFGEEIELEDEMINEDLMKLDPITNTLVGLAIAAGVAMATFDFWFGKDKDMRKPIEKGMDKAEKDGNAKLYHSLAAKYYEDKVTKYTKALDKLRNDPNTFYKKDSLKTGAKKGEMKKFEKRAEEELLRVLEIAKKKQKEFEAKEKSGEAISKAYYESVQHIDLDESKSSTGYELYHKDFSSAMAHAYDFAKKKYGIEVDPQEIDRNVAMGPRKPSSGKANAYRLLDRTGKKAIQVQVTNLDNKRYELNMYKEEIELEESKDEGASKKKETEFHTKLDKLVHKTFGSSPSEKKEKMKKEEKEPPFTPDKPKKNPGVVPGKHGAGPSIAKHLAKMAMKKQQEKKPVKEASSPAQQAAIAISMKKAGKTPKEEGVMIPGKMKSQARKVVGSIMSEEEIAEAFSSAQIDKLRQEYSKINKVDPSSDTYKKLTAMLDKLDLKTLQSLAGAKIKFVSSLAQNRVVRKMNEEKTVGAKKEATGNEKPVKKGEKVSGKQEPITIDPEVDEKK